ncbi:helix-turn-helix domain-containing protein [Bacillus salacetis]|uniref:helix-turn-helix domain-containing protein n=1 Tax=Bacillus salacetis TaxID=2315464 RepID=UPI003BA1C8F8
MKKEERDGEILGRLLRKKRLERKALDPKWTISYLAEQAKLEEKYVGRLLRGQKVEPQYVTIGKLADALGMSQDYLWEQYLKEKARLHEEEEDC